MTLHVSGNTLALPVKFVQAKQSLTNPNSPHRFDSIVFFLVGRLTRSQLVIEDLCELWSLFQQKLEIRLQQRFAEGGFSNTEVKMLQLFHLV